MKEPFDIELNGFTYAVFPEENDIYTIYLEGQEYLKIQKDTEELWIVIDSDTDAPIFTENEEAQLLGKAIASYTPSDDDTEDDE